jgi:hypothetical protein
MNEFRPLFEKIVDTQMDSFAPFARCIEIFKMGMSKIDTTSKPLLREQVEDARHVAKINNDEERQVAVQEFDNKWKWDLAKKAGMMLLSFASFVIIGHYGNMLGKAVIESIIDPSLSYIGGFLPSFSGSIPNIVPKNPPEEPVSPSFSGSKNPPNEPVSSVSSYIRSFFPSSFSGSIPNIVHDNSTVTTLQNSTTLVPQLTQTREQKNKADKPKLWETFKAPSYHSEYLI